MAAVEEITPEKIKAFTPISLWHADENDISTEISSKLTEVSEKFVSFLTALD